MELAYAAAAFANPLTWAEGAGHLVAAAAFGKVAGSSGGASRTAAETSVSGTTGADTLAGLRPESQRGGEVAVVFQIGTVLNNDDSRRDLSRLVTRAQELGELRGNF